MARLYEISADFAELFDQFDSFDEIDDDEMREAALQAWYDTLEGIEGEFEVKAESVAQYIKALNVETAAIKAEEDVLRARRKTKEKKLERLKTYLQTEMERIHRDKIETARCRISIRNNAQSVRIADEAAFIEMLQEHDRDDLLRYETPTIRKTEIKKLMESGEHFDGAELVRTRSLIVR